MNKEDELKLINTDIIFFFLLVVTSMTSFYIINEKKRRVFNMNNLSNEQMNNLFRFNRRLIVVVDIYFVINAYVSYNRMINDPDTTEQDIRNQQYLMIATTFILIGALFFLPINNSNAIINR